MSRDANTTKTRKESNEEDADQGKQTTPAKKRTMKQQEGRGGISSSQHDNAHEQPQQVDMQPQEPLVSHVAPTQAALVTGGVWRDSANTCN